MSNVIYRFSPLGNQINHALRTQLLEPPGGDDEAAVPLRLLVGPAPRGANAQRGDVVHEVELSAPAYGTAVRVEHALRLVGVVHVSVEVDHVERAELSQPTHHRKGDGVVAAHDDGKRAALDYLFGGLGELAKVANDLRRNDSHVAAVGHGDAAQPLVARVDVEVAFRLPLLARRVLVRVDARPVPHRVRAVTRPRPSARALVERHAQKGHVGVQLVQVVAQRRAKEAARLRPGYGPQRAGRLGVQGFGILLVGHVFRPPAPLSSGLGARAEIVTHFASRRGEWERRPGR